MEGARSTQSLAPRYESPIRVAEAIRSSWMLYSLRISSVSEIARPIRFGRNITSQVMSSITRASLRELYNSLRGELRSYVWPGRKYSWPDCGNGNSSGSARWRNTRRYTAPPSWRNRHLIAFDRPRLEEMSRDVLNRELVRLLELRHMRVALRKLSFAVSLPVVDATRKLIGSCGRSDIKRRPRSRHGF